MALVDRATVVRAEKGLDLERLEDFIAAELPRFTGPLKVMQFPSGFSNLAYLLQADGRKFVLRRPPFGTNAKSAHDMGREYRVLKALQPAFPYCPKPFAYCEDESLLGCHFYLMEYRRGVIIRKQYPTELNLSPAQIRHKLFTLINVLAQLHQVDFAAIGLADLGRPQGYTERQVGGWSKRYRAAHTEGVPDFETTMNWLAENLPPGSGRVSIIHNDFKLDNVIWDAEDPLCLIGILDWEMTTLGDPLMDLGCMLGYWVEKGDPDFYRATRRMPTDVPGAPSREEIVLHYAD